MVFGSRYELLARLGEAVKRKRLGMNVTQKTLADRSGVSVSAVKHIEAGCGATLGSFVLVCRTLGKDGWINAFTRMDEDLSPIAYAEALEKSKGRVRLRARASARG